MADFDWTVNDKRGRSKEASSSVPGLPFQTPNLGGDEAKFAALSQDMAAVRRHTAALTNGSSLQMAMGRPRDPMFYWKQNNIPFDFTKPEELKKIREFCNTPDAPVIMADGTSKLIGDIVVGDRVMGWKYLNHFSGGMQKIWEPSTVLSTSTRQAAIVQVTFASGKTVKCTPDHKWANPLFSSVVQWTTAPNNPATTPEMTTEYLPASVGNSLISCTYNPPTTFISPGQSIPFYNPIFTEQDEIVDISPIGTGDVVSMQTSTGNYTAWGFASKNCRLLYLTHPVIAACVDIYSKLPLQGMHIECKDEQLTEFYHDLFFDQLHYEDHLVKMGRQYWLAGETFSIGAWNETLGVWEDEQIINPDDVEVETSLFLQEPRFLMRLPESLRNILSERSPRWEFQRLVEAYPELMNYVNKDDLMPVSNVIMKQMKFEADDYTNRGISILMRAYRSILQEEMMMTAMDSIADRLYTPMIVARLGASAQDLGTEQPWIPTAGEKQEFLADMESALAADFRVMVTHFAVDIDQVFGRENMPDMTNDFDRLTERILMSFGLSQTMLTGASAGETYAADALNRDVVTQLLTHYQRKLQQFFYDRASIVAEAQEHYDYEVRNGMRYLITEEIYEVDEETGEERIIEQPKLLVPELKFKILNLTDESAQRDFLEQLAMEGGVPVPIRNRIQSTGIDFDEMVEIKKEEIVKLAVAEQEGRKESYLALKAAGLPIPEDLLKDFAPKAIQMGAEPEAGSDEPLPTIGALPQDLPVLAPGPDAAGEDDSDEENTMDDQEVDDETSPQDDMQQEGDDVPSESNEQRERMPKPATLKKMGIKEITKKYYVAPDNSEENHVSNYQPTGKFGDPRHLGMRRHLHIPDSMKLPRDNDSE